MSGSSGTAAGTILPKMYKQTSGPDGSLCAWFAVRHFTGKIIEKKDFIKIASKPFEEMGLSPAESEQFVKEGNDPEIACRVLDYYLPKNVQLKTEPPKQFGNIKRIFIACVKQKGLAAVKSNHPKAQDGHFFAVLKIGDAWYDYNSWDVSDPTPITDIAEFMKNYDLPQNSFYWE